MSSPSLDLTSLTSGRQGSNPQSAYTAVVWGPRFVEKVFSRFGIEIASKVFLKSWVVVETNCQPPQRGAAQVESRDDQKLSSP